MTSPRCSFFTAGFFVLATAAVALEPAHWPSWRGPHDSGSSLAGTLPTKLTPANVQWKVALPGKGTSTPIVWASQIFLTAPVGGKDALVAYDASGRQLWTTMFAREDPGRHRNASGCNPSPVTDGQSLFVAFKSGLVAAVGMDGKMRWQTNLVEKYGPVKMYWDYGTSPVLTARHVVVTRMHEGESWLAAFDKASGELRWKTARNYRVPKEVDQCYSTPLVVQHEGREALLTWGADHVTLHDAKDGKLFWACSSFEPAAFWPAVASPVIADGVAVVCFGRADKGQPRLHGIKLGGKGDVTKTNHLWKREDAGSFVPTPALYQGKIYVLSDRGQVECIDPATGKKLWSDALPRSSSNYYASPLIAGGVMYAAREDGALYVARVEGGFKLLGESKLNERVIASPVPLADRLLIRGESHLYCMAE